MRFGSDGGRSWAGSRLTRSFRAFAGVDNSPEPVSVSVENARRAACKGDISWFRFEQISGHLRVAKPSKHGDSASENPQADFRAQYRLSLKSPANRRVLLLDGKEAECRSVELWDTFGHIQRCPYLSIRCVEWAVAKPAPVMFVRSAGTLFRIVPHPERRAVILTGQPSTAEIWPSASPGGAVSRRRWDRCP